MSETLFDTCPEYSLPESVRVKTVVDTFTERYKCKPEFLVQVPGRVNLIGEHIDYCGYGVCPMAIELDIILAVSTTDNNALRLSNMDRSYEDFACRIKNIEVKIGEGAPGWYQYVLCGIRGILDILPSTIELKGMNILVHGTIPPSAGLSSSSALVSASALATSYAFKYPVCKEKLASLCAICERYIGTQGGGMDQAIAFLATKGCAKHIEFAPLRWKDITLPDGAVFVIAHSLAKMNKAATTDFNCRVVECRLASQIMAKQKNLNWVEIKTLGQLQQTLGADLQTMAELVESTFHEEPYTKEEVLQELEILDDELENISLTPNTKHIEMFKLKQRAAHVFQESLRVDQFIENCKCDCSQKSNKEILKTLGELMTASHISLRDLYECSHPQLDKLVDLSSELALGVRLTGAGWGGCAVALVEPDNVEEYMSTLKKKFYSEMTSDDILLFATSPNAGACIYTINSGN
nr:N-acetylgalactosamine kinase [Onthophagus taurus]